MGKRMLFNCLMISAGSVVMLISIFKSKMLLRATPFVRPDNRRLVERLLSLHRLLMFFFLLGYFVVLLAFLFNFHFVSDTSVSVIFFFGAIFVWVGISVQSRLLSEMSSTLRGLLPICACCKKIRIEHGLEEDPSAWKNVEDYIAEKAAVNFTHGLCPHCYEEEIKRLK